MSSVGSSNSRSKVKGAIVKPRSDVLVRRSNGARTPMKIMWLGLRGFPGVQGGVETHAEFLCPLLEQMGCDMHVITRSIYQPPSVGKSWRGVLFHSVWSPRARQLEAIVHTFLGVLYAGIVNRPDLLHIQAIGPGLLTPLARLFGLKVIVTHHGPDYDRQKWGKLARVMLRVGEWFSMRMSNERIVISEVIRNLVRTKHNRDSTLIHNGLLLPDVPITKGALDTFGLQPGKYLMLVSRLVREKRHIDLIEAFARTNLPGWKLVLVGAADHPDAYTREVTAAAASVPNVVMTGFQTGLPLRELYTNAGLFVLPSSHEGLPIAILEALSYGLPVVASDIPANLEIGLPAECYFPLGDVDALAACLVGAAGSAESEDARAMRRDWATAKYSWPRSARQTLDVYKRALGLPVTVVEAEQVEA
ncbi:glycosyltransferase family 4 protein [soil metagenome]